MKNFKVGAPWWVIQGFIRTQNSYSTQNLEVYLSCDVSKSTCKDMSVGSLMSDTVCSLMLWKKQQLLLYSFIPNLKSVSIILWGNLAWFLIHTPTVRHAMNIRTWSILLKHTDTNGCFNVLLNHQLLPTNVQYTWTNLHTWTLATVSILLPSKSIKVVQVKNEFETHHISTSLQCLEYCMGICF